VAHKIRILLADDHPVVRLGLSTLLRTVPDMAIVGETESAQETVEQAIAHRPDIVIMDVRLRDGSGVEACREIRSASPKTRVLMLTSFSDEEAVIASILAGAAGYLLKETEPQRLIEAIETVASGGSLLDAETTRVVLGWMRQESTAPAGNPLERLSAQEQNILPLIADGKTNREIGRILSLSEFTVKTYISNILQKLQLTRRTELAAFITRMRMTPE
jgi:two-component system, NarL family, response regulator DevR